MSPRAARTLPDPSSSRYSATLSSGLAVRAQVRRLIVFLTGWPEEGGTGR
jgi:hypothetical protein